MSAVRKPVSDKPVPVRRDVGERNNNNVVTISGDCIEISEDAYKQNEVYRPWDEVEFRLNRKQHLKALAEEL